MDKPIRGRLVVFQEMEGCDPCSCAVCQFCTPILLYITSNRINRINVARLLCSVFEV